MPGKTLKEITSKQVGRKNEKEQVDPHSISGQADMKKWKQNIKSTKLPDLGGQRRNNGENARKITMGLTPDGGTMSIT